MLIGSAFCLSKKTEFAVFLFFSLLDKNFTHSFPLPVLEARAECGHAAGGSF
jgi:hypothetical protein